MKSAGPGEVPAEADLQPLEPDRRRSSAEECRAPAGAAPWQVAIEQDEDPEQERRGHDDAEEQPEAERLPAERLVEPLAPLPGDVLERREHDRGEDDAERTEDEQAADEPPPDEAAGDAAVEDDGERLLHRVHHPGCAPEREPEGEEAGEAPGRRHRGDQRVELRDPLRREIELVADRGDEILLLDLARRQDLGEDRRHERREGNEREERAVGDRRCELRAAEATVEGDHLLDEGDEPPDGRRGLAHRATVAGSVTSRIASPRVNR